jgi:hypothetical protein
MPADGHAPDAALVQAVRSVERTAERISYWTLGSSGGIPDPNSDKAVVEFDISGLTCNAYVSGRAQGSPRD